MTEVFKSLPKPLLDPYLLEHNLLGRIPDRIINKLLKKKLEEFESYPNLKIPPKKNVNKL